MSIKLGLCRQVTHLVIILTKSRRYVATGAPDTVLATEAKKPRLYTKTGDKGNSGLFTGERRRKDDSRFEALGATDELSSAIGLAREFVLELDAKIDNQLEHIQCCLQDLQSVIATPQSSAREAHLIKVAWDGGHLKDVEKWTDDFTQELPALKNFILPVS